MTDILTPERRSENMRRIQAKNTSPEMAVRRLVHRMGFRYRLHVAELPGKPDLVFPRLKKIIEVRGCFWHPHIGCIDSHVPKSRTNYWRPKLRRNLQRDKQNEKTLRTQGWEIFALWECELKNLEKIKTRLKAFLQKNGNAISG